jgi:hypothetical protein
MVPADDARVLRGLLAAIWKSLATATAWDACVSLRHPTASIPPPENSRCFAVGDAGPSAKILSV